MLDWTAMTASPYDTDLDRNPANFQPLTPLRMLAVMSSPCSPRHHQRESKPLAR